MPPTVFISYSHKDEIWKERLVTHLGVLQQEGLLRTWNDRNINAGEKWFEEIQKGMDEARVAVLLISADSLNSEFIRHKEIPHLLDRREKEGMTFFPVIVKSCVWDELPWLSRFLARPRDGKPLADFRGNRLETELTKIAKEILEIVRNGSQPSAPLRPAAAITSTLPSLHQLPAPAADFTGREEDLETLRSALTQGGTGAIFGLRGLGGVGKTALALKLAEELTPRYPDAQLYLDLKGVDPQPLSADQAMAHAIRSFHPEAQLPEDGTALAGLYRSVLFGKSTLLLMDNAASREQVEPLIPPKGSLLLVTSRFHFMLPGLVARDLDEMGKEDARGLLLKMAPRIGNGADEIARLYGRLPLALRLAGSVLAERKDLSPSEYTQRLKKGKDRLGSVDVALNLSYGWLNAEQQRLWRILAVFPGTFDTKAAAAVWKLESDLAKEALSELVRCSLVEWEEKEERYRLHDLARQFADQRIDAAERDTVQQRHAKHFLKVLAETDDLYLKGGEAVLLALRRFDIEWGNLQSGYAWAAGHFLEDNEAARICGDYPDAGTSLLLLRLHPREHIRWREIALAAARQRKDKARESVHLGNLGLAYAKLGDPRRAIEFFEQDLALSRSIGNRLGEASTLGNLGIAYSQIGDNPHTLELFEQVLGIAREIKNRQLEGYSLGNVGIIYRRLGKPRRAIEFFGQALAFTRELGDRYGEGNTLGNLGLAYADLGKPRCAIEFYEQTLVITRELGDRRGEADTCWNLGLVYEEEGHLARAADLMQICVDFEQEIGHADAEEHAAHVQALRARSAEQS
jgi:tetratricopeptide (TPR) repeat protein